MRHLRPMVLATLAAFSIAGCERKKAAQPAAPPPPVLAADVAAAGMLAAAEPFEALAEGAFTAPLPGLDRLIATVKATGEDVKPALPHDAQVELKTRLDEIAAARQIDNRAGIARGAVEAYRLLVSNGPGTPIPTEVSLLDYAGMRYDTELRTKPVAWDDMAAAAAFGQDRWKTIEAHVTDKHVHDRMTGALADMAAAASLKDPVLASLAVRRELNLVDLLEGFFSTPKG